jgi:hypothetical protein
MPLDVFVPLTFFLGVVVLFHVWYYVRAASLLQRWAEQKGHRLIRQEQRQPLRGPFFWTTSGHQAVYRVTVEDQQGDLRCGWVRLGSWLWGPFSDRVEVRWDDEQVPAR